MASNMIMVCDSRHHNEFTQLKGTIYSIARKPYGEKKKIEGEGFVVQRESKHTTRTRIKKKSSTFICANTHFPFNSIPFAGMLPAAITCSAIGIARVHAHRSDRQCVYISIYISMKFQRNHKR